MRQTEKMPPQLTMKVWRHFVSKTFTNAFGKSSLTGCPKSRAYIDFWSACLSVRDWAFSSQPVLPPDNQPFLPLKLERCLQWIVRPLLKQWTAYHLRTHAGKISATGFAITLIIVFLAAALTLGEA